MNLFLKRKPISLYLYIFLFVLCFVVPINAEERNLESFPEFIFDNANLLSLTEKEKLIARSEKYADNDNTAYIILTENDMNGKDNTEYISDFYDQVITPNKNSYYNGSCSIFIINMQDRKTNLYNFGKAKDYLDANRSNEILDNITTSLTNKNYTQACLSVMDQIHKYMSVPISQPGNNEAGNTNGSSVAASSASVLQKQSPLLKWWVQLIAACVIGACIVAGMAFRSGGIITTNSRTYLDERNSGTVQSYDHYIRTVTSKTEKPKNTNPPSDNHSSGGTTSGGSSFSSGNDHSF